MEEVKCGLLGLESLSFRFAPLHSGAGYDENLESSTSSSSSDAGLFAKVGEQEQEAEAEVSASSIAFASSGVHGTSSLSTSGPSQWLSPVAGGPPLRRREPPQSSSTDGQKKKSAALSSSVMAPEAPSPPPPPRGNSDVVAAEKENGDAPAKGKNGISPPQASRVTHGNDDGGDDGVGGECGDDEKKPQTLLFLRPEYRKLLHPTEVELLSQLLPLGHAYRVLSKAAQDVAVGKVTGLYTAGIGAGLRRILQQHYVCDVQALASPSGAFQLLQRYRLSFELLTGLVHLQQEFMQQQQQHRLHHRHPNSQPSPAAAGLAPSQTLRTLLERLHQFLNHQEAPMEFRQIMGESVWLSVLYATAHFVAHGVVLHGHKDEFFIGIRPAATVAVTSSPPLTTTAVSTLDEGSLLLLYADRLPVGITEALGMEILLAGKSRRLLLTETHLHPAISSSSSSTTAFGSWGYAGGGSRTSRAHHHQHHHPSYLEQLALGAQDETAHTVFTSIFSRRLCGEGWGGGLAVEELGARIHSVKSLWSTALWERLSPAPAVSASGIITPTVRGRASSTSTHGLRDRLAQLQDLFLLRRGDVWGTFVERVVGELLDPAALVSRPPREVDIDDNEEDERHRRYHHHPGATHPSHGERDTAIDDGGRMWSRRFQRVVAESFRFAVGVSHFFSSPPSVAPVGLGMGGGRRIPNTTAAPTSAAANEAASSRSSNGERVMRSGAEGDTHRKKTTKNDTQHHHDDDSLEEQRHYEELQHQAWGELFALEVLPVGIPSSSFQSADYAPPSSSSSAPPERGAPTSGTNSVEACAQRVLYRMAAIHLQYRPHQVARSSSSSSTYRRDGDGPSVALLGNGIPLIITAGGFTYYQHLFQFLLKINVSIAALQRLRTDFAEAVVRNQRPSLDLRRALALHQLLYYFLHTLQQYLQVDVFHPACQALWEQMEQCTGLEAAQRLHQLCLWRMVEGAFLSGLGVDGGDKKNNEEEEAGVAAAAAPASIGVSGLMGVGGGGSSPLRDACEALCQCALSFVMLCQRYRVSSWAVEVTTTPPNAENEEEEEEEDEEEDDDDEEESVLEEGSAGRRSLGDNLDPAVSHHHHHEHKTSRSSGGSMKKKSAKSKTESSKTMKKNAKSKVKKTKKKVAETSALEEEGEGPQTSSRPSLSTARPNRRAVVHGQDGLSIRPTPVEVRACLRALHTRLQQRVISVFVAHLSVSRQPTERALWIRLDFNKFLSQPPSHRHGRGSHPLIDAFAEDNEEEREEPEFMAGRQTWWGQRRETAYQQQQQQQQQQAVSGAPLSIAQQQQQWIEALREDQQAQHEQYLLEQQMKQRKDRGGGRHLLGGDHRPSRRTTTLSGSVGAGRRKRLKSPRVGITEKGHPARGNSAAPNAPPTASITTTTKVTRGPVRGVSPVEATPTPTDRGEGPRPPPCASVESTHSSSGTYGGAPEGSAEDPPAASSAPRSPIRWASRHARHGGGTSTSPAPPHAAAARLGRGSSGGEAEDEEEKVNEEQEAHPVPPAQTVQDVKTPSTTTRARTLSKGVRPSPEGIATSSQPSVTIQDWRQHHYDGAEGQRRRRSPGMPHSTTSSSQQPLLPFTTSSPAPPPPPPRSSAESSPPSSSSLAMVHRRSASHTDPASPRGSGAAPPSSASANLLSRRAETSVSGGFSHLQAGLLQSAGGRSSQHHDGSPRVCISPASTGNIGTGNTMSSLVSHHQHQHQHQQRIASTTPTPSHYYYHATTHDDSCERAGSTSMSRSPSRWSNYLTSPSPNHQQQQQQQQQHLFQQAFTTTTTTPSVVRPSPRGLSSGGGGGGLGTTLAVSPAPASGKIFTSATALSGLAGEGISPASSPFSSARRSSGPPRSPPPQPQP